MVTGSGESDPVPTSISGHYNIHTDGKMRFARDSHIYAVGTGAFSA